MKHPLIACLATALFFVPNLSATCFGKEIVVCNPAGLTEDGIYIDAMLNQRIKDAPAFPKEPQEKISAEDTLEAFGTLFLARGWGDGLPLVPPTPERVQAMVEGSGLSGDMEIAALPPLNGVATVEKIAVNAVMAGCRPEYMPLLIAAVEAVSDPDFDLLGSATTTNPDSVLVIASGPMVKKLGLNAGTNSFGRGNRANASISRALHLIIQNVGGSRVGLTDMSTLGQPADFAMFLAENEDANPWKPIHTEFGFMAERNVVTVAAVEGYAGIMGIGFTRPEYLDLVANYLKGHDRAYRREFILVIAQDTAKMLAKEGFDRKSILAYIRDHAKVPYAEWFRQFHGIIESGKGLPSYMGEVKDDGKAIQKPFFENIHILVSGGTGEKSMILPCWANGKTVSREVVFPVKLDKKD